MIVISDEMCRLIEGAQSLFFFSSLLSVKPRLPTALSRCLQLLGLGGARCQGNPHLTSCLVWSCHVKRKKTKGRGGEQRRQGLKLSQFNGLDSGSKLRQASSTKQYNLGWNLILNKNQLSVPTSPSSWTPAARFPNPSSSQRKTPPKN